MNLLTRKLEGFATLGDDDRHLLDDIVRHVRELPARADLIREGDRPDDVHLVLEGLACRYKLLEDGTRSIMAFLVPGDFCDLHIAILGEMDHAIGTLAPSRVVGIPRRGIARLLERPAIARALWWSTLVDEGILREWLVNMGTRDAPKALAHLFCELFARMKFVGLVSEDSCDLPITQEELSDAVGTSAVHTNRSLQELRRRGLIEFESKRLTILDPKELIRYSGFHPNYLHRRKAGWDRFALD